MLQYEAMLFVGGGSLSSNVAADSTPLCPQKDNKACVMAKFDMSHLCKLLRFYV